MQEYREGQRLQGSDGNVYVVTNGVPTIAEPVAPPMPMPTVVPLPVNPVRAAREAQDKARQDEADARARRNQQRQDEKDHREALDWTATHNADGSLKPKPLSAADAKPSEFQSKSAGFLGRMMQAEKDFGAVPADDRGGRGIARQAFHDMAPGLENTLVNSEGRQKADQAVENFIAASLRQESGASISPQEFTRQYKIFFPAPGDSEAVLAQKAEARRQAIEGFKIAAGPLAESAMGTVQGAPTEPPAPHGSEVETGPATFDPKMSSQIDSLINAGASKPTIDAVLKASNLPGIRADDLKRAQTWIKNNPGKPYFGSQIPKRDGYQQSIVGQGMSGVNEGLASVAGLPVDLTTGALNLGVRGLNALTNSNIPRIENPTGGSQFLKDTILAPTIGPAPTSTLGQVSRRIGQSVGAAAVPAAMASTPLRALGQLASGFTGGSAGAAVQQGYPGHPVVEMLAEMAGGGAGAGGFARAEQRAAQRGIEAAVPSIEDLKGQAGQLYRAAESRGVVAGPQHTQDLADTFRAALTDEGQISPTGRIANTYPKASAAQQLIDDYAGQDMTPTQMQTVRRVASDGLMSPDGTERRLGRILTDTFDEWANPLAPELSQARDVASRYLTAEQLTRARELAGARAGQFSGSGFENALRTEYRGLDRAEIKNQQNFGPDVVDAIHTVARGTPGSNFFRGLGKLYPSGVVSGALGSGLPGIAAGVMSGSPGIGATVTAGMTGLGALGRAKATQMGLRAADQAELIARNGGALPKAEFGTDEIVQMLHAAALAQAAKYQNP